MSRGREYQYERIDRALEAQDDWYLQRRKEIQEEDEYVQTKLEISQPGDAHEQEADRIAFNVVCGGDATLSNILSTGNSIQPKSEGESTYADSSLQNSLSSTKGSGQSLDDSTRGEMESKMGVDFSGVKIHTDSSANQMSESINAKAFTHGQDVYFGSSHSPENKELLAHELVHTVQQESGGMVGIQRKPNGDFLSPWVKKAISYNSATLNSKFKAKFIWKLFYVTGNETQRDDAFADAGYSDGFAHLVHSAQLLLFPSEFLEGNDISPEAGKFNERTYRAVLDNLKGEPKLTDYLFNAIWYNVNIYKVDMASAEINTLFTLMEPLQQRQSEEVRLGEINLTISWGDIQSLYLLSSPEFKLYYLSASAITEARANYDRQYPNGKWSVTPQQPLFVTTLPTLKSMYTPEESATINAPGWLWTEVQTEVVDKVKWDERAALKKTDEIDFSKKSDELFADDIKIYIDTYKDAKEKKGPVTRLLAMANYDSQGKKLAGPVTTKEQAEFMIKSVFKDLMRAEFNEEKAEAFVWETRSKLDNFDVLPVSSTGYSYYAAKYQLDKQDKVAEYAAKRSGEIEKEFQASMEAKSKPIKKKYEQILNDFIAAKEAEYEPKFIDAIKTGDAHDDLYAPMFRKLQVERGDPLTAKQQELETEMLNEIEAEQFRLNGLMFAEIDQIQVDLQATYNKRFELDVTAYASEPVFLTKEMVENAKKNVDRKKSADKKDEDVSSSDYSDRLRDYIYDEWYTLSASQAFKDLHSKAVPYSKYQTSWEDRMSRPLMMGMDGRVMTPPSDVSVWSYHYEEWYDQAEAEFYFLLMSREMVDGMGRPSYAALKWWAMEWFSYIMDQLAIETDPEAISLYNKAVIHMLDIMSTPEEDKDFWDEFGTGFFRGEPTYIIPFIGDFIEINDLLEIKDIADRYVNGDEITTAEKLALQSYGALQDIESRGYSLGLTIGSGVRQAIPFIVEFVATFGVYAAAKTVLVKSGVKLLKNTMKTGMKQVIKRGSIELISSSLAAGLHAVVNPQVYFKTYINNNMPRYITFIDGEGMMVMTDVGDKMSMWENIGKTAFSTYVDFWTEHLGGFLLKQPKAILTRILNTDKRIANSVISSWLFNNKLIPKNSFFKTSGEIAKALGKGFLKGKGLLSKYNIGNVGEEFFEEYIATRLNDWYDGTPFQIFQQADVEALITTLFISGPMQIVGIAKKTYQTLSNPNGNVVLNVRVMENDKPVDKEFEFPSELIQKLDGLGKVDVEAASAIIDAHFTNNSKYTDPTEIAKLRSVLLTYHVQGQANVDVAVWAYSTLADGNLDIAYSVVHLQGPTPVTPDHIIQLRKLPAFAPVADTLEEAIRLKTDNALVVSMQNVLGSNQLTDVRRVQITNAWMKGMQYMERPLTGVELDGEVTIADHRAEMKEDIQPVYDWLRLPKESSVNFLSRADQLRGNLPIAEFVEQNKDNIMKYRLDDPLYKGFVESQNNRVDASSYSETTKQDYKNQQKAYSDQLNETENIQNTAQQKEQSGLLEDFEDVDAAAQQDELLVNLENRVTDNLFGTTAEQAVSESGNKRFRRTFERRKRKFNEALLDPTLDPSKKKRRTEKYMRRLERSFRHHDQEGAVNFEKAATDVDLMLGVEGQQRYIMNADGTFVMDGKTMTLTQLQQQVDSSNLLMQFNGLPRRYSYTTRSVKVGKEVQTEVIVTSSETGPFPNVSVNRSDNADVSRMNTDATISLSQRAGPEVLLEEYAHLWLQLADRIDPSLINSVMTQVQQTQAYQQMMNDPFYGPLGRASADPARYWVNEVLAQAVRTNGASLGTQTKPGWFTTFVSEMWEAVLNALRKLGFNIPKSTQAGSLGNMTVEQFVQLVRGELTQGQPLTNATSQEILDFLLGNSTTLNIQNSILSGKEATGSVTMENWYGQEVTPNGDGFDPTQRKQPEFLKVYISGKEYLHLNNSHYEWIGNKWEKVEVSKPDPKIGIDVPIDLLAQLNVITEKSLKPQIKGEDRFDSFDISLHNGRLWIRTLGENGKYHYRALSSVNEQFSFVITMDGILKIGFGHYYLSGGASNVLAAGSIEVSGGKISFISNGSGHYYPTKADLELAIEVFQKMEIMSEGFKKFVLNFRLK